MFIETRFYDSGKSVARLHKCENEPEIKVSNDYDGYVDEIESLEDWIEENLSIETDDIIGVVLTLDRGKWADITDMC